MDPTGWWPVLLNGTIGAAFTGFVAAVTAIGVLWQTQRREEARAKEVAMRGLVGEIISAGNELVDAIPRSRDAAITMFWRMDAAALKFRVEAGHSAGLFDWAQDLMSPLFNRIVASWSRRWFWWRRFEPEPVGLDLGVLSSMFGW
jgi:hypothetical protein